MLWYVFGGSFIMSFILGYFIGQLVLFFLLMMTDGGEDQ